MADALLINIMSDCAHHGLSTVGPGSRLENLFVVDARHHGKGKILFAWHPDGAYVATTGTSRVVHIFDSEGSLVEQIVPPSPSICTSLQWDSQGEVLAILQGEVQPRVVSWPVCPCAPNSFMQSQDNILCVPRRCCGTWSSGRHENSTQLGTRT